MLNLVSHPLGLGLPVGLAGSALLNPYCSTSTPPLCEPTLPLPIGAQSLLR